MWLQREKEFQTETCEKNKTWEVVQPNVIFAVINLLVWFYTVNTKSVFERKVWTHEKLNLQNEKFRQNSNSTFIQPFRTISRSTCSWLVMRIVYPVDHFCYQTASDSVSLSLKINSQAGHRQFSIRSKTKLKQLKLKNSSFLFKIPKTLQRFWRELSLGPIWASVSLSRSRLISRH